MFFNFMLVSWTRAFPNWKNIVFTSLNEFDAQICCTKATIGYYFKHNTPFKGFCMKKQLFWELFLCIFLLANISTSYCCYLFFDLIVFRRLCGSVTEGDLAKLPSFVSWCVSALVFVHACVSACLLVHVCACAAVKVQLWNFNASHFPLWRTSVITPEKVQTNQIVPSRYKSGQSR